MTNIHTLEDIATLSEPLGLECKLAAGREGAIRKRYKTTEYALKSELFAALEAAS
jgi:hypothetical protein